MKLNDFTSINLARHAKQCKRWPVNISNEIDSELFFFLNVNLTKNNNIFLNIPKYLNKKWN